MVVDICDLFSPLYFLGVDYEPETSALIRRVLRPGDVAFDLGANAGYFTLLMASLVGVTGHIHCFEPNPPLTTMLAESITLSGYQERVTLNRVAVSDRSSKSVKFYISQLPNNSGVSALTPLDWGVRDGIYSDAGNVLVDVVALDDYVREHGITRCDLLKIDVECSEAAVVRGMQGVLEKFRPRWIICETGLGGDSDLQFRAGGYVSYRITNAGLEPVFVDSGCYWGNIVYVPQECASEGNDSASPGVLVQSGRSAR
jgi:FkbM family methyltransferase